MNLMTSQTAFSVRVLDATVSSMGGYEWLKLRVTSTELVVYLSVDGLTWHEVFTQLRSANTNFLTGTIDQVGLVLFVNRTSATLPPSGKNQLLAHCLYYSESAG